MGDNQPENNDLLTKHHLDMRLQQQTALWDSQLQQYLVNCDWKIKREVESFKATTAGGQNAIKHLIFINGGAAVALLTFIGTLWTAESQKGITGLSWSLLCFTLGVLCGGIVAALTYLSQYNDENATIARWINYCGIGVGVVSLVLFLVGTILAFNTFVSARNPVFMPF